MRSTAAEPPAARAQIRRRGWERPPGWLVRLAGLALAGLVLEIAVVVTARLFAGLVRPRPPLLTHLIAGGSLLVAGWMLTLGWRGLAPAGWRRRPALLGGLAILPLGLLGYGFYVEPAWLDTPRVEVTLADLPLGFDGYRIALISDLHAGPYGGPDEIARIYRATSELAPDLVVLLGDFVASEPAEIEAVVAPLGQLRARDGLVGVLGNHDLWIDPDRISAELGGHGVRLLRNAGLPLERGPDRLWLAGLDDLRRGQPDLRAALAGGRAGDFVIVLAHNPLAVELARPRGLPLTLAGHTHGGQIQLPFVGPLLLPIDDRGLAEGLVRRGPSQVFVTRGVGLGTPPIRLGARPEIPLLVLRRG